MRKTALKKKSPAKISVLKRKLWELCKRIIRATYPPVCYICGKPVQGSNDHTSHFIPSATCGAYLRYDLRNLRRTCYNCNINLGGNGAQFYWKMTRDVDVGVEAVERLFADKQVIIKADSAWYLEKIKEYEEILEKLK